MHIKQEVDYWIRSNRLVRVEVLKGRGVRQVILGRVIRYDEDEDILLVYHVDEKSVHNIKLNEIESIQPA